ncbi:hypothetical protein QTP70_004130 [Hemibagrus guttatus]|uniref:ribonuclease H n=1 Tax=Hemibagrus guttatus TaxID=175788 RepID=A0AAE0QI81_9TELE|nr:hypothetical protein QTP70_004130 [Hemibagrus guttatus]
MIGEIGGVVSSSDMETPSHQVEPGDYVYIRVFKHKHWKEPRREGPFKVVLTTPTAVKVEDKARGIDKILSALLDQGVVVPVHSSYNTPVNPVPKPNVVHSSLQDLVLPEGVVVLQYADDLLISAETADICKEATWSLLNRLAQQGFKVSLSKLQFCKTEAAELVALTRACTVFAEKDVTIYTDSRYAFGVAHDFGRIWQTRGFVSAEEHAWRTQKSAVVVRTDSGGRKPRGYRCIGVLFPVLYVPLPSSQCSEFQCDHWLYP